MNRTRLILLGILVLTAVCALTAHRLPSVLDPRLTVLETNSFAEVLLRKAQAGNARAQYWLGLQYARGLGRKQDPVEAINWLTKAAEQGLAEASLELAEGLEDGSIEARSVSANELLEAGGGEVRLAPTQVETANWYRGEALKWYRKAAEQGLSEAQYRLGLLLRSEANRAQGTKTPWLPDPDFGRPILGSEYWDWWQKAADQGHVLAAYWLAFDCEQTGNYAKAAKWFKAAADRGSRDGTIHLAYMYHDGRGVPQDHAEAVGLLLKIVKILTPQELHFQDHLLLDLCDWYQAGPGALQDDVEAYKWFTLKVLVAERLHGQAFVAKEKLPFAVEYMRDILATRMSPPQRAEGHRRATEFLERAEARDKAQKAGTLPPADSLVDVEITGSAFFLTEDGYICTAYHVVASAKRIAVRTKTGSFPANLLGRDAANDLAILKAEGKFRALPLAASRTAQLGEPVFTIGFPNVELQGFQAKLTRGEISSLAGIQDDPRYFQISVPVQPGNSGGPLVDLRGNVVGIVAMQMDDAKAFKTTGSLPQNINYAVKATLLSRSSNQCPTSLASSGSRV